MVAVDVFGLQTISVELAVELAKETDGNKAPAVKIAQITNIVFFIFIYIILN